MAFNPHKIFPIDTKPGTAVGIAIPFNAPNVFFHLLNFFLTNQTERYLNNQFGANLRAFIFEQISTNNISDLKENIQSLLSQYFTNIRIDKLDVLESPDNNEITVKLYYSIINTGVTDQVQISFT